MMIIVALILATLLMGVWLVLLLTAKREDWLIAAYNKVLDNRMIMDQLREKDTLNREKLSRYHGVAKKVMRIFLTTDSQREIEKLKAQNEAVQSGNMRSVSIFDIPGYAAQRSIDRIGKGTIQKKLVTSCIELYGRKYAVNKAKQLLARMISYLLLGVAASIILGIIVYGAGSQRTGSILIVGGILLVSVLVYAQYDEVGDRLNKRRAAISAQFPNVVSKLALLVTSGMIMDRAWRETAESQELELYREMRTTADELQNLVDPAAAYTNFLNRCNTKETTKLASAIIQSQSKGNAEIGVLLKNMAKEAWQERRHTAKRAAENANSKLMIPTMLLFLAILVMIMVPIAISFSSM